MKAKAALFYILYISVFLLKVKAQTVIPIQTSKSASFRGLSIVNDKVAWVSGTKGTIGITTDGGINWHWQQVTGFEKADFRDIEAFSEKEAVIIASGSPAYILKTNDGGNHWITKFEKADTSYFLDAVGFADKQHGFVLGDPIAGKFLLLETTNRGESWSIVKNSPLAQKNEAAFAASGTSLKVDKYISIVTGGGSSRLLVSPLQQIKWDYKALPLTNGSSSRGAFSVANNTRQIVIVGGDYTRDKQTDSVAYMIPKGKTRFKSNVPVTGPAGYQSCVEYLKDDTFLSTGTSGTNLTTDGGKSWFKIDATSYNVCGKAKQGSLTLMAGDAGKLGIFKF